LHVGDADDYSDSKASAAPREFATSIYLQELQCFASRATRSHNSYAWRSVVFTYFAAATGHRKIPSFGKLMLLDAQDIVACADGHLTLFA
jgi:hypothetical protein